MRGNCTFFSEKSAIDLYWNIFEQNIRDRIANHKSDEKIKAGNERYIEKYGSFLALHSILWVK